MAKQNTFRMIGLMSGTSLDGLDLAYVEFTFRKKWTFNLLEALTVRYDSAWERKLATAHTLTTAELLELHMAYGRFLGNQARAFLKRKKIARVDAIASHGHTIFHQPEKGFTFQLGDGNAIHAASGRRVVADFRSLDVTLGGQGAPLVPVGDKLLFSAYDVCVNLGGIANLSMDVRGQRQAFDICFCNMALNFLVKETGIRFDNEGRLAAAGSINTSLLVKLSTAYNAIRKSRVSIGRELFETDFEPLLRSNEVSLQDKLRTVCESTAAEIADAVPRSRKPLRILCTGGGALNSFLMSEIQRKLGKRAEAIIPSNQIIEFKEALIFAFLGVLRMRQEVNVLRSVTKAKRDSCSGVLFG